MGLAASQQQLSPFESAALGAVDSVVVDSAGRSVLIVMGQSFVSDTSISSVAAGDYVFAGSLEGGQLDVLISIDEDYLLGVSEVRVTGEITDVDTSRAVFSIGSAVFEYSSLLAASPNFIPETGKVIEVVSNETVRGGPILVGIHGSGVRGIHGSGSR